MIEQWQELKETIVELRDNDGTCTQQEVCKFLANLMDILEKQIQETCDDMVSRGVFEQVMWERDVAIGQLKELGYELGQKIETRSNAISRQAVSTLIDELARAISDERCCISRGRSTATIMRDILHLPPIMPQPKTGRWIRWYEQKEHDGCIEHIPHCKCSECGKEYDSHSSQFIKYCNECGAKMQEEREG